MGISGIASTNSMSVVQMTAADLKDQKSKSIQTEITNAQQQLQKLSSAEDLSAHEKMAEQKKLQKEISGLNTKLKQHQEDLRSSQKREITSQTVTQIRKENRLIKPVKKPPMPKQPEPRTLTRMQMRLCPAKRCMPWYPQILSCSRQTVREQW